MAKWKDDVRDLVREFYAKHGDRTFTLGDFSEFAHSELRRRHQKNYHINEKIRQVFRRELCPEGFLSPVENKNGIYTYCGDLIAPNEADNQKIIQTFLDTPERREYISEIFVRNRRVVQTAREKFGDKCMIPDCRLTFKTPSGNNYIEIHHIKPLCKGGEDNLRNLSVLCAHHHRMAHFAKQKTRDEIRRVLEKENRQRLGAEN